MSGSVEIDKDTFFNGVALSFMPKTVSGQISCSINMLIHMTSESHFTMEKKQL